ncbi:MAG TPA: helix-turn-helix domain-containing protein [Candidatus Heimdallarchaeota archaeon]|nr:helix-turn-helix domain-containing protein [Candidatus Heimdallarchaeota archaeon]
MEIEKFITKEKFISFSDKYTSSTNLPLVLMNLSGDEVFYSMKCGLCEQFPRGKKKVLEKNCRLAMLRAVKEAFRWGEGYITACPLGLIIFAVPVVFNKKLIGGFLSGFAIFPEMEKDIREEFIKNLEKYHVSVGDASPDNLEFREFSLAQVRDFVSFLFILTREYQLNDIKFLKDINEKYVQQYKIANFLEDLKRSSQDVGRKIFDKQDEILSKVKLGDKAGAREILNEFLGAIFFESGMNFDILKVRVVELIVIISRVAIEAGVEANELLGLNYSYLSELNSSKDIDELLFKLTGILENFINKVSQVKEKKKKIKIDKVIEYIKQNFTSKITTVDIAKEGDLSVSRVLHLFKDETGLTITDYIKKLRIDYSKYLLLNTDISLVDSAIKTGFFDQSHFTKTFKRIERMTPSHFRKKYRREEA